jgi:hypothetical protein
MNAKEILQKYLDVDNTPMKGNEWIVDCMDEYAQSLTPKWRDISEIDGVEEGELITYKDRIVGMYKTRILTEFSDIEVLKKLYSHFIVLPFPNLPKL